jgi:hypothetical protein
MRVFAIGIEHALDVSVKRSHNADPGEHRRAVTSDEHQGLHCIFAIPARCARPLVRCPAASLTPEARNDESPSEGMPNCF